MGSGEMGPQSQGGLRSCDIKQRFVMSSFFSVPQRSFANKQITSLSAVSTRDKRIEVLMTLLRPSVTEQGLCPPLLRKLKYPRSSASSWPQTKPTSAPWGLLSYEDGQVLAGVSKSHGEPHTNDVGDPCRALTSSPGTEGGAISRSTEVPGWWVKIYSNHMQKQ